MTKAEGESPAPSAEVAYDDIQIRYFAEDKETKVKRHYEINSPLSLTKEWAEVPSVSTVLKVLDKPALPWWGMKIGVQGLVQLFNTGLVFPVEVVTQGKANYVLGLHDPDSGLVVTAGVENLVGDEDHPGIFKKHGLTTNQVKKEAGERGQSAHDAFEAWCKQGHWPNPLEHPASERGYIEALIKFLNDAQPEPQESEVIVGSWEHKFAGRYDVRLHFPAKREVVVHHTPKRGEQRKLVPGGVHLADLKTSKYPYPEHAKQLAGYEIASQECGFSPSDFRAVIHLDANGNYRYVPAHEWATPEDFLTTLAEWHSQQRMKANKPPGGRS